MRRIALYHFGWEHADGTPAAGNAGKAIRPALVLAAAGHSAASGRTAVRAAAAVELVHNFTLLHDDVMDRDTTRRHRPTAWTVFGDADAILAGDALQALALRLLAEDPHPASSAAAARLADCVVELCAGQHTDTAMERAVPARSPSTRCSPWPRPRRARCSAAPARWARCTRGRPPRTSRRWTRSAARPGSPSS
jgi:geranylgeranyl diphosphate synthase type I